MNVPTVHGAVCPWCGCDVAVLDELDPATGVMELSCLRCDCPHTARP